MGNLLGIFRIKMQRKGVGLGKRKKEGAGAVLTKIFKGMVL